MQPFALAVLQNDYGVDATSWQDAIRAFHTALWTGEFDAELQKTSSQIPAHYDSRHSEMVKVVREQFGSLARALRSTQAAEAMSIVPQVPETTETTEIAPEGSLGGVRDGDVTASLAADMTALELVEELNKQALEERAKSLQTALSVQAAGWTSACVDNGTEGRGA